MLLLLFAVAAGPGCGRDDSFRVPIDGLVRVDGEPAERVLVQLHYLEPGDAAAEGVEVAGNDQYPSALTDGSGRFRIGGNGQAGVLPGRYVVTFTWLSSDGLDAKDKFEGRLADAERSPHQVVVRQDLVEPLEFELSGG